MCRIAACVIFNLFAALAAAFSAASHKKFASLQDAQKERIFFLIDLKISILNSP